MSLLRSSGSRVGSMKVFSRESIGSLVIFVQFSALQCWFSAVSSLVLYQPALWRSVASLSGPLVFLCCFSFGILLVFCLTFCWSSVSVLFVVSVAVILVLSRQSVGSPWFSPGSVQGWEVTGLVPTARLSVNSFPLGFARRRGTPVGQNPFKVGNFFFLKNEEKNQ